MVIILINYRKNNETLLHQKRIISNKGSDNTNSNDEDNNKALVLAFAIS